MGGGSKERGASPFSFSHHKLAQQSGENEGVTEKLWSLKMG